MVTEDKKDFYIEYGDYSTEECDFIVADKEGLLELSKAIDEAIETGISTKNLDMFYGVICHEKDFFVQRENKKNGGTSLLGNFFGLLLMLLLSAIFISGISSVFSWFFKN